MMTRQGNTRKGKTLRQKSPGPYASEDHRLRPANFNIQRSVLDALDTLARETKVVKAVLVRAALDHFFHRLPKEDRAKILERYAGP